MVGIPKSFWYVDLRYSRIEKLCVGFLVNLVIAVSKVGNSSFVK